MYIIFRLSLSAFVLILLNTGGCENGDGPTNGDPDNGDGSDTAAVYDYELLSVAESERLWTGVAVSHEGRMFVNYPNWFRDGHIAVAELVSGSPVPYPSLAWNTPDTEATPAYFFVCVQSVYVDRENYLWILDPGQDPRWGILEDAPKLLKVDLEDDGVIGRYHFDASIAPPGSYLNDVRIDTERQYAYITDSGLGALVVVNLATKESRRLLTHHHSVKAEEITISIEGVPWTGPDGSARRVHSDGLALDGTGEYLYYQALTGRSMYRIATEALRDTSLSADQLGNRVEFVAESGASDAIEFGPDGNLYLTSIEHNAIRRLTPEGEVEVVIQHTQLKWPDSFAITPDGTIYVTTSQIHRIANPGGPFRVFKLVAK